MLDVILESQPDSTMTATQGMDIIYLNNANKDKVRHGLFLISRLTSHLDLGGSYLMMITLPLI